MRRKPVQLLLLHAAFFLALISVAPGTREILPRVFQAAGNRLLPDLGDGLSVRFEWADPKSRPDSADTRMLGRQARRLENRWSVVFSSHRRIFWPLATLVALTLATPMSRRRMAVALPAGLLLFGAFFLLEVAAFAVVLFGATEPVRGGSPGAWRRALPVAEAMFNSPITNFSVVFLLWAWLANPARGVDVASLNALLRELLGAGGGRRSPPAPPPPAPARPEAPPPDDGTP
jgi:hypothetical protein